MVNNSLCNVPRNSVNSWNVGTLLCPHVNGAQVLFRVAMGERLCPAVRVTDTMENFLALVPNVFLHETFACFRKKACFLQTAH